MARSASPARKKAVFGATKAVKSQSDSILAAKKVARGRNTFATRAAREACQPHEAWRPLPAHTQRSGLWPHGQAVDSLEKSTRRRRKAAGIRRKLIAEGHHATTPREALRHAANLHSQQAQASASICRKPYLWKGNILSAPAPATGGRIEENSK